MKSLKSLLLLMIIGFSSCTDSTTDAVVFSNPLDSLFSSTPETRFTGALDTTGFSMLVASISNNTYAQLYTDNSLDSLKSELCDSLESGCSKAFERACIETTQGKVSRSSETLTLVLENGKSKQFVNKLSTDNSFINYQFLRIDARGNRILAVFYYESYAYLIVNPFTGHECITIGEPILSPNLVHYISVNYDMGSRYTNNGVQLIAVSKDSSFQIGMIDPISWGGEEVKWLDDSTVFVKQKSLLEKDTSAQENYGAIRIKLKRVN